MFKKILFLGMLTASLLMMGCGGGSGEETRTYTVGGIVEGLVIGRQVTLLNNGGDSLVVPGNVTFMFREPIAHNGSYAITVAQQPSDQTCTVSNNSRSGMVANVSDVVVTCSINKYTVGGTVEGLASGQQVTLQNNGGDSLVVPGNGTFTFRETIAHNRSYAITVKGQPTGQMCTVSNGRSGSNGIVANVSDVVVICV